MKTTKLYVIIVLIASLAGILPAVSGPLGTGFTYQGRLKSAGQSVNGNYDLKFTLYDTATGGSQVGSPFTSPSVAVNNGNFTVVLDFGAVFDGNARWLEIGVRPSGSGSPYGTPSARQQITATPYALNVANVGSKTAAEVVSVVEAVNAATSADTANAIVKRDALGAFSAVAITADTTIAAANFSGNGYWLTHAGLVATTTLDVNNALFGTVVDTDWVQLTPVIGQFYKWNDAATSTIEITFNGRISVGSAMPFTGFTGAHFQLRVDGIPTTNGRASANVRLGEVGSDGIPVTITGIWTGLGVGWHTVSMYVRAAAGTGLVPMLNPGNWSDDHVVVKELK